MSETAACPHAADDDVLRQYVRGVLSDEAAEAFETHLFSCDRCDRELRRAVEVHAALSGAETVAAPRRVVPFEERRTRVFSLAAAAAVAAVLGLGYWWSRAPGPIDREGVARPRVRLQQATRGSETPPIVTSGSFSGQRFTATWKPFQRSQRYVVQFFRDDGTPLYSFTTSETSVTAALTGPMQVGAFYWNVQALDADGVAVARSELQRAVRTAAR